MALEQLMAPILDPDKEWGGMPEFAAEDQTSFKQIIVHFRNQEDLEGFVKITGVTLLTGHGKTITWYPTKEDDIKHTKDIAYVDGEA